MKFRNNWPPKRNWNNWNWNAPTHQATLKAFQRFNVSPQKKVFHPLAISPFGGLPHTEWDVKGHKSSIIYHKWRWSTDHTKHTDSVPFAKFIALQAYGQWRRVSRPHPHPRCRGWTFRTPLCRQITYKHAGHGKISTCKPWKQKTVRLWDRTIRWKQHAVSQFH